MKIEIYDIFSNWLSTVPSASLTVGDACIEADLAIQSEPLAAYALVVDTQGKELDRVNR